MKLMRFRYQGAVQSGIVEGEQVVPIRQDLLALIQSGEGPEQSGRAVSLGEVTPLVPYPVPPKIWCIGLNYKSHAEDIDAVQPEDPASFMKPASCMFDPGGRIMLPPPHISDDVDAEGELGVIIGKRSRFLSSQEVRSAIFGYTTTLDMTALDILRKNPRYLTRAKSIDTFFSFGPIVVTADEIADVDALEVVTEHNGQVHSRDYVKNMKARPFELVRFHSDHMTLEPGDLISTGCPKGARIRPGDRVRARIETVGVLNATVDR